MKKKNVILWLASFIIVFLAAYISNIFDADYPITSTIGIEGKKISYRFEKISFGKEDYKFILRSDIKDLDGKLFWKSKADTIWHNQQLIKSNLVLSGNIPALKPAHSLLYFAELYYKDKKYDIPDNQKVRLTFYGKIPTAVTILEFILMYLGIVLAVRIGLEYFNQEKNSKKFGVILLIIFLTLIALIKPLYLTYKYQFINTSIPPISALFLWSDITIFVVWVVTIVVIFRSNKLKFLPLLTALITLAIFVLFR